MSARALAVALGCAVFGIAAPAGAEEGASSGAARAEPRANGRRSDAIELDRVVELYLSGQYERCSEELNRFLDPESAEPFVEPATIERGRLYLASCELLGGRASRARAALKAALETNPLMVPPDSLAFPPPLISLFLEVREEVQSLISEKEQEQVARLLRENEEARRRARAREEREKELVRLATEQPLVVQNSRLIAWLPFGAGQYQNGDKNLGHFFLGSELVLTGAATASAWILLDLYRQSTELGSGIAPADKPKFDAAYAVLAVSTVSLVGVMAIGIAEAQLSFQPERVVGVRERPLPPHLRPPEAEPRDGDSATGALSPRVPKSHPRKVQVAPFGGPTGEGFQLGVVGRF